jgi:histidinol-phosphate/aromatic aminotransferase/cobyric acid decarboxylase-like protein
VAYKPGKATAEGIAHPIKLSANENILGSSPKAQAAYAEAAAKLNLYPDPRTTILREGIAAQYGLEPERLLFGCGSDEVFQLLCQTYLEPGDNMVQPAHGFAAWAIGARACGAEIRNAPEKDLHVDVDALLAQVDERTRLVFVANPANPTGTWIPFSEIRRLHEALPPSVVLVLDGAYAEFQTGEGEPRGLRPGPPRKRNIAVTRTFSKIYGLAALRVGWALSAGRDDRRHRPHPPAVQRQHPGPAGRGRGAGRRGLQAALDRPGRDLAALADPAAVGPRPGHRPLGGELRAGRDSRPPRARRPWRPRPSSPRRAI